MARSREPLQRNFTKKPRGGPSMGGPGGQEVYPFSNAVHRKYAAITAGGVLTAGAVMYVAKLAERMNSPGRSRPNILVHDMSKGELDNVKYLRPEELKKLQMMT
ncbi:hypothetical protein B0T17DRAFT_619947 [Bombardia bombarda]|uniref:Uncharacterized protein n=1 Tax=Bombardia bombarda TaxID=252184 RepID=A0AA39WGS8_9PEZI|nr:hypothetical protein B0T17DRAFT_619947 [Bombardia bombarda]